MLKKITWGDAFYYSLMSKDETDFTLFGHFDKWKKSKSIPSPSLDERDWEILKCQNPDIPSDIHAYTPYMKGTEYSNCDKDKCKIFSVRRLSDGLIFNVDTETNKGIIHSFGIAGKEMIAHFKDNKGFCNINFLKLPTPSSSSTNKEEDKCVFDTVRIEDRLKQLNEIEDAFSSGYYKGWYNGLFEEEKTISKKIIKSKFEYYRKSLPENKPSEPLPLKEESKVLFTTEDRVPVYKGDIYYLVSNKSGSWSKPQEMKAIVYHTSPYVRTFHDKERATNLYINHKPCLSLSEVHELANNDGALTLCIPAERISNFVKEKLKQL